MHLSKVFEWLLYAFTIVALLTFANVLPDSPSYTLAVSLTLVNCFCLARNFQAKSFISGHLTYLHGKSLFSFLYFFIFIINPAFWVFGIISELAGFKGRYFDSSFNKSYLLVTLGLVSFNLGYISIKSRPARYAVNGFMKYDLLKTFVYILSFLFLIICAAYLLNAEISIHEYSGSKVGNSLIDGLYKLTFIIGVIISSMVFYHFYSTGVWLLIPLLVVVSWSVLAFVLGDRNQSMVILMAVFFMYSGFVKKIPLKYLIAFFLLGVVLYTGAGALRKGGEFSGVSLGDGSTYTNLFSTSAILLDTAIECNDGSFSLSSVVIRYAVYAMAMIPFLQGILKGVVTYEPSAGLLTDDLLGSDASWSVGSNVLADIYLSGGFVMIAVEMFLLGLLLKVTEERFLISNTIFRYALLVMLTTFLFQLPRYEIGLLIRPLIWVVYVYIFYGFFRKARRLLFK